MPRVNEYNANDSIQTKMTEFGFNANAAGICTGASMVALEIALNEGSTNRFDQLVQFIHQTSNLREQIEHLQHKRAALATRHRFHKSALPELTNDEQFLFEAYAMLNQIQLYQSPALYYDLFGKTLSQYDANIIAEVAYSNKSFKNNGLISDSNWPWSGIYDHQSFKTLLESVQSAAGTNMLAFTLTGQLYDGEKHKVTLVYETDKWTLTNINEMPSRHYTTLTELTDILFGLFSKHDSNTATLSIAPFSLGNNATATEEIITTLKESREFTDIHNISKEFIKAHKQSDVLMLAQLAMAHKQTTILQDLINSGVDVNATLPCGHSLCYLAAQYNDDKALTILVEAGADINNACGGATPIYIATERQHTDMVDRLLKFGANPDCATIHGTTPISKAADLGNLSIVTLLHEKGVDLTKKTIFGTPLEIAENAGHNTVVDYIKSAIKSQKPLATHTTPDTVKSSHEKKPVLKSLFSWLTPSENRGKKKQKQKKSRQAP